MRTSSFMDNQTKMTAVFSAVHFVVLITCFMTSFSLGMDRFDEADTGMGAVEYVAGSLTYILMYPAKLLWIPWASKNLPNILEWVLMIGNSFIWGSIMAYLFTRIRNTA